MVSRPPPFPEPRLPNMLPQDGRSAFEPPAFPIPVPAAAGPAAFFERAPIRTLPDDDEVIKIPDIPHDYTMMNPADSEQALRDLMHGTMNQELDVDMTQAVVEGFKDDIKLLPHQILGRAWLKLREDLSKKKTGGILADDMGCGLLLSIGNVD